MKPSRRLHRFSQITQIFFLSVATPALSELQWPLKEKTYITGTFGEFRRKHIHAGTDISTLTKTGLPVYAGEAGFVYRIKTQCEGYGKAVYLKLNDGKILVYAHLDRFISKIEKIVSAAQEKEQQYEIDTYPKEKIPVQKGEIIGYSGDTGGVSPHLHIELRDKEEKPINILKHGLHIDDKTLPFITGLAVCDPIDTHCITYYSAKNIPAEIEIVGKKGLAVSAYDLNNGNRIGVYELFLIIDQKLYFKVKFDKFSYDEFNDNFILCNKDLYVNHGKIYYHLFRAFNNTLPFYTEEINGLLDLAPGNYPATIIAIDNSGNKNILQFNIVYKPSAYYPKYVQESLKTQSKDGLCNININKEDLYYPLKINIYPVTLEGKNEELIQVSKIYNIAPIEAVFRKAVISIKQDNKDRVGLYRYDNGKWKYMDDNVIYGFTHFALFKDITPPNIKIVSTYPIFRAKIKDAGSGLDYKKLSIYIDGKKTIAEYSVNRKELFCKIPKPGGKITCEAYDRAGNINKQEITI